MKASPQPEPRYCRLQLTLTAGERVFIRFGDRTVMMEFAVIGLKRQVSFTAPEDVRIVREKAALAEAAAS